MNSILYAEEIKNKALCWDYFAKVNGIEGEW